MCLDLGREIDLADVCVCENRLLTNTVENAVYPRRDLSLHFDLDRTGTRCDILIAERRRLTERRIGSHRFEF